MGARVLILDLLDVEERLRIAGLESGDLLALRDRFDEPPSQGPGPRDFFLGAAARRKQPSL